MRFHHLPPALLALYALPVFAAGPHWSLTEDFYAFPKYRVTFLNGLPVLNETAQRWLQTGLKGGVHEFLEQPWKEEEEETQQSSTVLNGIESSQAENVGPPRGVDDVSSSPRYRLERMKLSGKNPYLCLIPPPIESHTKPVEEPQSEASPIQSLSLLQPLANTCIYHRQGWFTYAYCHNSHVRQFREMAHAHPHVAGYVPEEDPEWEAYTLGQAPTLPSDGRELTNAQQEVFTNNVDIVKTAGHRYLVQKMGGGTICDKTGRPREIEVQFHCSQTMTDTILFVKETSTCHYIMVIHTPRLCGEPGFKTRLEQREEAFIRCREILDSPEAVAAVDKFLPATAHPFSRAVRQPMLDIPPPPRPAAPTEDDTHAGLDKQSSDLLKAAIEAFLRGANGKNRDSHDGGDAILVSGEDGDILVDIEFIDADDADGAIDRLDSLLGKATGKLERLEEKLRAAVEHDVKAAPPGEAVETASEEDKQNVRRTEEKNTNHEEL